MARNCVGELISGNPGEVEHSRLFNQWLPLVSKLAGDAIANLPESSRPVISEDDLWVAGAVALDKAIRTHNPGKVALGSWLRVKIYYAIIDEMRSFGQSTRRFFNVLTELERESARLSQVHGRVVDFDEVLSTKTAKKYKDWQRMNAVANCCSLDSLRNPDDETSSFCIEDPRAETPLEVLSKEEMFNYLRMEVDRLREPLRVPVDMYYWGGHELAYIGGRLKVSHQAVCNRLHTARTALHSRLNHLADVL